MFTDVISTSICLNFIAGTKKCQRKNDETNAVQPLMFWHGVKWEIVREPTYGVAIGYDVRFFLFWHILGYRLKSIVGIINLFITGLIGQILIRSMLI